MMKKISVWGAVAVLLYLGFVGFLFMYVSNCEGMFCEAGVLLAVLPWFFLFDMNSLPVEGYALFWILVIVDMLILYFLFAALQKWMQNRG